jgi:hypothetical protein
LAHALKIDIEINKNIMKTPTLILVLIYNLFNGITAQAQRNHQGNTTQPQQINQPTTHESNNDRHYWQSGRHNQGGNWGGGITIQYGNYPNYYGNYNGNGYGNGNNYSIKRVARNSIRQSAQVIRQALQFSDWNDMFSPWLAKAIRHQQYAKQLYFWGDYAGALNHAERSGFLAWNTLSYFNNSYGYDDGYAGNNYPNPYTDPNNPYYRKHNNGSEKTETNDEDPVYKKNSKDDTYEKATNQPVDRKLNKTDLDNTLPQSKLNDKELLKINTKDLDVD